MALDLDQILQDQNIDKCNCDQSLIYGTLLEQYANYSKTLEDFILEAKPALRSTIYWYKLEKLLEEAHGVADEKD